MIEENEDSTCLKCNKVICFQWHLRHVWKHISEDYSIYPFKCSVPNCQFEHYLRRSLDCHLSRHKKSEKAHVIDEREKYNEQYMDCFEECFQYNDSKESWEMNSEEKIDAAEKFKIRGTTFFQQGKIKLAIGKYKKIVDLLEYEKNLEAEVKEKRDQLYIAAHLNLGLCFLKKKEAFECIKHCDKVIELDDSNVKALYRRAQGREIVKDYEIAAKDYEKVLTIEPDNKAAKSQLLICHKQLNKYKDEEKKRYKNMFSKISAEDIKGETLSDEAKRNNAFPNSKPDTETNGVAPPQKRRKKKQSNSKPI